MSGDSVKFESGHWVLLLPREECTCRDETYRLLHENFGNTPVRIEGVELTNNGGKHPPLIELKTKSGVCRKFNGGFFRPVPTPCVQCR